MNILYLKQLKLNAEFWFVPVKIRYKFNVQNLWGKPNFQILS